MTERSLTRLVHICSAHPLSPFNLHPPLLLPSSHSQALLLNQMALLATSKSGALWLPNLQKATSLCLCYGILGKYSQTSWLSSGVTFLQSTNWHLLTHQAVFGDVRTRITSCPPTPPKNDRLPHPSRCFCRDSGIRRRSFDKEGARYSLVGGSGHQFW